MDPFFDDHDEEENVPDSAFGPIPVPGPNRSQESHLPLSRNAAPPAGGLESGGSMSGSQSQGVPQGWNFDDDDFISGSQTFPGTSNYPPPPPPKKPKSEKLITVSRSTSGSGLGERNRR
jgi:phospholipid-transporting ATPase